MPPVQEKAMGKKKGRTISITTQMIAAVVTAVVLFFSVFFLVNNLFLPKYYEKQKARSMVELYDELKAMEDDGTIASAEKTGTIEDEGALDLLRELAEKENLEFAVLNSSNEPVIYASRENDRIQGELLAFMFRRESGGKVIEETDKYEIVKSDKGGPEQGQHLQMWGDLSEDYSFIIRTPVESFEAAATLSNQFMFRIGLIILALSVLCAWLFANRFTRPIRQLADLSTRMSKLDFKARYTGKEKNEIGVLGESFNQMSDELEKKVSELKNANYQLQKDLDRRNKQEAMHQEFIGNIAHELKTPIAVISGYAEGLKEGIASDEESRSYYCDVIVDETERMNQIIHNMMLLDQLEYGAERNDFERFNIIEVIHGLLSSMDILIRQKEANISLLAPDEVYVWADEFMTEQVLSNYINNALNHLSGEKKIEIKVGVQDEKAHISVFNSGEPIPEDQLERIWDKFYKVDKARSRAYGGHGIGLSIVKAIMESFKQKYGVENYRNGVMFWFELSMR